MMAAEIRADGYQVIASEGQWLGRAAAGDSGVDGDGDPVLTESSGGLARLAVAEGDVVHDGDLIAVVD